MLWTSSGNTGNLSRTFSEVGGIAGFSSCTTVEFKFSEIKTKTMQDKL